MKRILLLFKLLIYYYSESVSLLKMTI